MTLQSQIEKQLELHQEIINFHAAEVDRLDRALTILKGLVELGSNGRPIQVEPLSELTARLKLTEKAPQPRRKVAEAKARPAPGKPSQLGSSRLLVLEFLSTNPKEAMGSGDIARRLESKDLTFKSFTNAIHYLKSVGKVTQIQRADGSYVYHKTPTAAPTTTKNNGVAASASTTA